MSVNLGRVSTNSIGIVPWISVNLVTVDLMAVDPMAVDLMAIDQVGVDLYISVDLGCGSTNLMGVDQ